MEFFRTYLGFQSDSLTGDRNAICYAWRHILLSNDFLKVHGKLDKLNWEVLSKQNLSAGISTSRSFNNFKFDRLPFFNKTNCILVIGCLGIDYDQELRNCGFITDFYSEERRVEFLERISYLINFFLER